MDYLKKIHSSVAAQVHSVAAQVSQALPGNPIFREYTIGQQIGSAGPGLCWKIYAGTKNTTKQEVSIWLFERKQSDNWVRVRKEELPEMLKRGVGQLTRLRHPRILTVERALEESRDCFAFCTEPIYACLANCFGDWENIQTPLPPHLKEFELLDVERRHGLYQISEALSFLHNDTKTVHCNISPQSIVINAKGAWKLGGFDFCILGNTTTPGKVTFDLPTWSQNGISALCPDLDYVAPELAEGVRCDAYADIFALGVLAFATFSGGKPILASQNSFARHRDNLKKLKQSLPELLAVVPEPFRDDVKMCLNESPELRPDAIQFTRLSYFEHPLLKTLNCLEQRSAMDNTQKMQLFKGLPSIMSQFPKRALLQQVFPHLASEFATTMLIPFILPCAFLIAEQTTPDEFAASIMPSLVTVFPIQTPYQITLLLLQRVNLLLEKMPTASIKQHLLPLVYNSLTGDNARIQELALTELPNMVKFVDREQMRTQLLPKLLRLVLESRDLTVRIQSMVCLAKLLPHLEPWMVADQLLPALPKTNSKDPAVLMAVLGIYKMVHESDKFGINKEQCARSVLPFLISTAVEPTLNLQQFGQYMELVHALVAKVEQEQRHCLEQLSAGQEEQRRITDFADFLNAQSNAAAAASRNSANATNVDLGDLAQILAGNNNNNGTTASLFGGSAAADAAADKKKEKQGGGTLTLVEKRRIAAEKQNGGGGDTVITAPTMTSSTSIRAEATAAKGNDILSSHPGDPFSDIAPFSSSQHSSSSKPQPSLLMMTSASSTAHQTQRPTTSHGISEQQNLQDFLSEFLSPSSTTQQRQSQNSSPTTLSSVGGTGPPVQLAQSASFAAFPSIALPPPPFAASANPIQRRAGALPSSTTTTNSKPIKKSDPFDGLDQLLMAAGGAAKTETTVVKKQQKRDPFDDLLR